MNQLVCGRMKQGKTTLAIYLAKQRGYPVIVWNPRPTSLGDVVCYGPDQLQTAIEQISEGELPVSTVIDYRFDAGNYKNEFDGLVGVILHLDHYSLVVDDAADLQGPNWMLPSFQRITKQHLRNVEIYQTTHSLSEFNSRMRDNVTDLYCFSLMGRSLDSVIQYTDGTEREANLIRGLEPFHYAHWNHATNTWEVCQPISLTAPVQYRGSELIQ